MRKLVFLLLIFSFSCGKENVHKCCAKPPVFEVFGNATIFFPNIFTPNLDGVNDLFRADGTGFKNLSLKIKKNGEIVFETSSGLTELWSATTAEAAKYTFEWSATSNDNVSKSGSGEVCLVRDQNVENCSTCAFSTQFDGSGFDAAIPHGEAICD